MSPSSTLFWINPVCFYILKAFLKKFVIFFYFFLCFKLSFLIFLDYSDALMSNIFFLKKNIILIHFRVKNTLKSNRNYTPLPLVYFKIEKLYVSQYYRI
jgi:hypothetical protein